MVNLKIGEGPAPTPASRAPVACSLRLFRLNYDIGQGAEKQDGCVDTTGKRNAKDSFVNKE